MNISKSTFDNLSDKTFSISIDDKNTINAELVEVKSINSHVVDVGQAQAFSLIFSTAKTDIFDQMTYIVNNSELEEMAMFLVPIGSDEKGVRYEAVFT